VFGECGGYMVLGEALVDQRGERHGMAGLLPVETSFVERRLSLGYRQVELAADAVFGADGMSFRGHEFHYARVVREGPARALFRARDAAGRALGDSGLVSGSVAGSFVHLVDRAERAGFP
ncbi:MAG: cobyrinic acid a,c-diamide synthase, partial [Alphaproteobacteria bacterium]